MGLKTTKILGINVTISSKQKVLEEIRKCLGLDGKKQKIDNKKREKTLIIFTPNPEIIIYAQKDELFKRTVNSAQINIPDGQGVIWGIKKLSRESIERVSGTDFMLELCDMAAKNGARVGLIGGRGGVALEVRECLRLQCPKLKIEVFDAPEIKVSSIRYQVSGIEKNKDKNILNTKYLILNTFGKQSKETEKYFAGLAKEIIKRKTDILFVALGFPKQEYFINSIKYQVSSIKYNRPLVLMAVGGAFDYISDSVSRAPDWMRKRGWEWLYRLVREPWRLPRQLKGAQFFWRVLSCR